MHSLPPSHGVADEFAQMWADLLPVGRTGSGYRRLAWTDQDADLRDWFVGECGRRGLDVSTDRIGNQWAWWGDIDGSLAAGRQGVVIGSHLDSVRDGGAYAGALGVVSALAAVDELRERGFTPERPLGVVNFVESAGARFGVACLGSRVVTGEYDAARALALRDADGVSLAEAMRATGHDADLVGPDEETMRRVGTFVELRLEPGPRLAELGAPAGVGAGTRTRAGGGPDADGSPFDDALVAGIAEALGAPVLDTPAEYDAGVLARAGVDVAMLFVRNPTGVSQAPDETADWRDCLGGVAALTDVVERLVHTGER